MNTNMVKVRVLVVVDSSGDYAAAGSKNSDWADLISCADGLNGGKENQFWLTAELPVPEEGDNAPEVAATITPHALGTSADEQ